MCYFTRRKNFEYLPNDEAALVAFRIKAIETFTLSDMMFVNADTLASLQIMQSESHPNSHMQGPDKSTSGAKESLSVFGLLHHLAHTPQGRRQLRKMFLRPSMDVKVINERLDTIGILLRPENSTALQLMVKNLKKLKDIRSVVIHLQKGNCNKTGMKGSVWMSLQNFTFYSLKILEAMKEIPSMRSTAIGSKVVACDLYTTLLLTPT